MAKATVTVEFPPMNRDMGNDGSKYALPAKVFKETSNLISNL